MIAPPLAVTRRTVLAFAATAGVAPATGQSPPVVAWLSIYPLEQVDRYLQAFRSGLMAQGFVDGRNVRIIARSAEGDRGERLAKVVAEIVAMKPAVIATQGGAIYGVRDITTIPVVYGFSGDPDHRWIGEFPRAARAQSDWCHLHVDGTECQAPGTPA